MDVVRFRRAVACSLLLLVSFVVVPLLGSGCTKRDPNVIVIATNAEYKPFEFRDVKTNEIVGFDIDLFRAIAKEAGLTIEKFEDVTFNSIIAGIVGGRYDAGISCFTINEERKKQVLFSDPYHGASLVIIVRADETRISSAADIKRMVTDGEAIKLGAQMSTTGAAEAKSLLGDSDDNLSEFENITQAFLDLANGNVDAVINDGPNTAAYVAEHEGYRVVGEPLTNEEYGIAIPKSRPDLLEKINAALKKLRESGELDALKQKWKVE